MTDLLTVPEVVARLRVSRRQVYRLMDAGRLRYVKIGRRTFVKSSEIEAFIASLSRRAA